MNIMNIINACHGGAFDEMDNEIETSYSSDEYCQSSKCALNEEPPNARCISVDSESSDDLSQIDALTDGHGDIFNDYVVYPTILGTGTYGCVRECRHKSTGKKYAAKTIEKAKVVRKDHIGREIQMLRAIDHPGIMKMVDCYEDAEYVHIITELCTGGELFDSINEKSNDYGCFSEDEAARIVKSLLEAVQYLHRNNIVHRDIKPENLLFESSEEGASIKLIDFGLSRTHGRHERHMTNPVGTHYYMSPGVIHGKYDRSCDIWAVGIVAYILLDGYPPFNGATDDDVKRSILRGNLTFEEGVWGRLSIASRDFVSKMLCADPSKAMSAEEALRHPWIASA